MWWFPVRGKVFCNGLPCNRPQGGGVVVYWREVSRFCVPCSVEPFSGPSEGGGYRGSGVPSGWSVVVVVVVNVLARRLKAFRWKEFRVCKKDARMQM